MDNSEDVKKIPEVYISQLRFNNDQTVEIKKNDIVVFVGPNNAGKSQALRDIWNIAKETPKGVVVKDISTHRDTRQHIIDYLRTISLTKDEGSHTFFSGYKFHLIDVAAGMDDAGRLRECRDVFLCHLRTDDRLSVCNPPPMIDRNDIPHHPVHQIVKHSNYRETVTDYFKMAFGLPLIPNTMHGKTVPLCLGDIPSKTETQGNDAQEMMEWYAQHLEKFPVLHEQGDGMRSFAGILLFLSIDYYRTFLIDEPESFLHPPQAKIMGHVIAKLLKGDQQSFISTHSQHFIKGLLEEASNRVKIIRITRDGNNNTFSVLDNNKIGELFDDPLLKYSEVLDGMFYKNVVICESDADCRFYSIVNDFLKEQQEKFSETLFVHSSGKERLETIARTLKALNIDYRVIPDIDIMNQEDVFKKLIESCGGCWTTFQTDYKVLVNGLENVKNLTGNQLLQIVQEKIPSNRDTELSRTKMKELKDLFVFKSRWDDIKHNGISGAPRGDATVSMNNMVDNLKKIGIFVVPVGELECFVKEVGDHGPSWLNKVLEKYPDLNDEVYNEAKHFVSSWNI